MNWVRNSSVLIGENGLISRRPTVQGKTSWCLKLFSDDSAKAVWQVRSAGQNQWLERGGGSRELYDVSPSPDVWKFSIKKIWRKIKCQVPNTLKISPPLFSGYETKSRLAEIKLKDTTIYM